jgi:hypothetical protein
MDNAPRFFRSILAVAIAMACLGGTLAVHGATPDDLKQARIAAASAAAVHQLYADIVVQPLAPGLSVGDFLKRCDAEAEMLAFIQKAQPVGGPRWADDQTCQVRLALDGAAVAGELEKIAASHPRVSPLPTDILAASVRSWRDRVFSDTGTSTSAQGADSVLPPRDSAAWAAVSAAARRKAVDAAREDAIATLMASVQSVNIVPGETFAGAMKNSTFGAILNTWMSERPVTLVDFREDLRVEVSIDATADELFDAARDALLKALAQPLDVNSGAATKPNVLMEPGDAAGWAQLRTDLEHHIAAAVGHATAIAASTTQTSAPAVVELPPRAPQWIDQQLSATASGGSGADNRLLAAHAAQEAASAQLRRDTRNLPLTATLTVGDAADRDTRIAAAVDRALAHARLSKVDFRADGTAQVTVVLNLSDLWNELAAGSR